MTKLTMPQSLPSSEIAIKNHLTVSALHVRMGRAGLKLTISELAALADVSSNTLVRFEAGEQIRPRTLAAIQAALEAAGIAFVREPGRVGVFLASEEA